VNSVQFVSWIRLMCRCGCPYGADLEVRHADGGAEDCVGSIEDVAGFKLSAEN